MPKLYAKLNRPIKELATPELRKYFPEGTKKIKNKKGEIKEKPLFTNAFLMRTIIMNEKQFIPTHYNRTLRGFWYSTVKPTLDRLGLLEEKDNTEEGLTKWDATLSYYVGDLLRKGLLTYSDLNISDTSRQKENPHETYYTVDSEVYGYKGTVTPYPNIIIATEKDTVYSIIQDIAQLFGCTCISCKGQNSLGAMESIVRGMFANWRNYPDFDTVYILTMTDYDPAGYYIARALKKQCEDILYAIGKNHIDVEIKRIGITPDQLPFDLVEANKYTPKKANIKKWMELTNGIDGEEKGLELDALSPDQIREIFVDEMREFIDEGVYKDFIKASYIKSKSLEAIKRYVELIYQSVKREYEEMLVLEYFDIFEIAKNGQRTLNINDLVDNDWDEDIFRSAKGFFK